MNGGNLGLVKRRRDHCESGAFSPNYGNHSGSATAAPLVLVRELGRAIQSTVDAGIGKLIGDMTTRAPLVVPALSRHTATVIWAHGLGDSGAGWMPIVENWRLRRRFPECKFVFPNAPNIPITVNFGMQMPGWYDITTFDSLAQAHDQPGIFKSREYFNSLINAEIDRGIASTRIVIGGFSQGGAISLFTGITSPHRLGGIVGLSSYLLLHDSVKDHATTEASNKETPIFMGHGDSDPLVRYQWGMQTEKTLKEMGWKVDFKTYKGLAHSADPEEIDDLEKYLEQRLPSME